MIDYVVDKITPTSLTGQSVFIIMSQEQDGETQYRRYEMTNMPVGSEQDIEPTKDMWSAGTPVGEEEYSRALDRSLTDYYRNILHAIDRGLRQAYTLDMTLATALDAIAKNKRKAADFHQLRSGCGLEKATSTPAKTLLLTLIQTFTLMGLGLSGI